MPLPTFSLDRFTVGDAVCVLILHGELDLAAAPALKTALHDLHTDGYRGVVLDLSPLQFIDSTGLSVLIAFQRRLGERLALAEPRPFVAELLHTAGLTGVLDVFSRLDDALARVGVVELV